MRPWSSSTKAHQPRGDVGAWELSSEAGLWVPALRWTGPQGVVAMGTKLNIILSVVMEMKPVQEFLILNPSKRGILEDILKDPWMNMGHERNQSLFVAQVSDFKDPNRLSDGVHGLTP